MAVTVVPRTLTTTRPVTWIGRDVKRKDDPVLLTGSATYVDDIHLDGMLYAGFVRSTYAHAIIKNVDFSRVGSRADVCLTAEGKDFALPINSWMNLPNLKKPHVYSLAPDKVRYVGEPVAAIVAKNRYLAEDAVENVEVSYERLDPIIDAEQAISEKRNLIFEDWKDNLLFTRQYSEGDSDGAISKAHVVVKERLRSQRHSATPIETRGVVASYKRFSGELTAYISTQMPHLMRSLISESLGIDENRVRVIAPQVGGGYGLKSTLYQDELAVCQLAMSLGKPVKWIETRTEHMLSSAHARDQIHYVEAGFDREGLLLGMKDKIIVDFGAGGAVWNGIAPALVTCGSLPGPYNFRNFSYDLYCVVTNKTPFGAHRGFGRPVASFVMERVMDIAAHKLGMDPALIRMKNMIQKSQMPYKTPSGLTYDSGDYSQALNLLLRASDYAAFRQVQERARGEGKYLGIGLAMYVEFTAPNSSSIINVARKIGGHERVELKFNADGTLTARLGVANQGQAHLTIFAQILAEELSLDVDDISIIEGDTDTTPFGFGAMASRCTPVVGGACIAAAREMKEKLLNAASILMQADMEDLELGYRCVIDKESGKRFPLKEVTKAVVRAPEKVRSGSQGLDVSVVYEVPIPPSSYGAHAVVVEVDPESGFVKILKYVVIEDCGIMINPMTVHGQTHGSLAHGIGGAMYEELPYTEDGQPQASTFVDYLIPTAREVPDIHVENTVNPGLSLGGFKGMGEGATIPAAPALANAIEDALLSKGVTITELPLSPMNILNAVKKPIKSSLLSREN